MMSFLRQRDLHITFFHLTTMMMNTNTSHIKKGGDQSDFLFLSCLFDSDIAVLYFCFGDQHGIGIDLPF